MKKLALIILTLFVGLSTFAQGIDTRRKINVSGSAEKEVTPDIIYVGISLKEYLENGNSRKKVEITTLEKKLVAAVQKAGIPAENLTINNLYSWNYIAQKKKNPDFLASKQYKLKVADLNKFNLIMESIDAKGVMSTNIESYDYSKMDELRKELRLKAIKAAKDKATYMVEAVGSTLGKVLEINDSGDNMAYPPIYRTRASYGLMEAKIADASEAPEIDFKKIKLSLVVNAVFEIN